MNDKDWYLDILNESSEFLDSLCDSDLEIYSSLELSNYSSCRFIIYFYSLNYSKYVTGNLLHFLEKVFSYGCYSSIRDIILELKKFVNYKIYLVSN